MAQLARPYSLFATAAVGGAFGCAVATALVLPGPTSRVTSYFATSRTASWAGAVSAAVLLAAGSYALLRRARPAVAGLTLALGCAWLAPVWVGADSAPAPLRSLAAMAAWSLAPLLGALGLALALVPWRWLRYAVGVGVALLAAGVLAAGLVHNHFHDLECWANCADHAFVAVSPERGRLAVQALHALTADVGGLVAAVLLSTCVAEVVAGGRGRRSSHRSVLATVVVLAAGSALLIEADFAVLLLQAPTDRFDTDLGRTLFAVQAVALTAIGVGVGWIADDRRRVQWRMDALVRELRRGPPAGGLEAALRQSLRDPQLSVHYWMRERGRYVDAEGRTVAGPTDDGRTRTRVVRGEEPVALVLHAGDSGAAATVADLVSGAAGLALENERLRAESLAHLADLTASRSRILAAADARRRGIERDLHDGAQQRLLAVTFELRLARADAEAAGDTALVGVLDDALGVAGEALVALREFAHGVFPAVLDESGLEEGLWSLADRSSVPVRIDCRLDGERHPAAERTAYLLVKDALAAASGGLSVEVERRDGVMHVSVTGVGQVDEVHLDDLVGAAGGELRHRGDRLEAVIPCAR